MTIVLFRVYMLIYTHHGQGVLNTLINKLPFELHLPGYQFCGPGTNLEKRLQRGDSGVNGLDAACKVHDIAYSQNKSLEDRHKADWILENKAWERVKDPNSKFGEKAAAWFVTTAMKTKRKLGMGIKKNKTKKRCGRGLIPFKRGVLDYVEKMNIFKNNIDLNNRKELRKVSKSALQAARVAIKKAGGRKKIKVPRIIPFEAKEGGFLPLLPILAGLGSLGSLAGGASAVAKTIIDAKNAKKKLEEQSRHNRKMEEIGKQGSGLYLRKNYRNGYGLYLKKQQQKNC